MKHSIELLNIFELLINNSIFSVMSGHSSRQLNIAREQSGMLAVKLKQEG